MLIVSNAVGNAERSKWSASRHGGTDMHRTRKHIWTLVALLIPAGLLAVVAGPTLFAGANKLSNPVVCAVGAQLNFNPPLQGLNATVNPGGSPVNHQGNDTTNPAAVESITVSGTGGPTTPIDLNNCVTSSPIGNPDNGSIPAFTFTTPAVKTFKEAAKPHAQHYQIGACDALANPTGATEKATLKALKSFNPAVTWQDQPGWSTGTGSTALTTKGVGTISNDNSEQGLVVQGAGTGDYAGNSQITLYLDGTVLDGGNWYAGCSAGTVSTVAIDSNTSALLTGS